MAPPGYPKIVSTFSERNTSSKAADPDNFLTFCFAFDVFVFFYFERFHYFNFINQYFIRWPLTLQLAVALLHTFALCFIRHTTLRSIFHNLGIFK